MVLTQTVLVYYNPSVTAETIQSTLGTNQIPPGERATVQLILAHNNVKCKMQMTGVVFVTNQDPETSHKLDITSVQVYVASGPDYGFGEWTWRDTWRPIRAEPYIRVHFPWTISTPDQATSRQYVMTTIVTYLTTDEGLSTGVHESQDSVIFALDCPSPAISSSSSSSSSGSSSSSTSSSEAGTTTEEDCYDYLWELPPDVKGFIDCYIGSQINPCVIATAAYGSPMAPEVVYMRNVRDGMIGSTPTGRVLRDAFNTWYYSWSPLVASWISTSGTLRAVFRELLVPIVASVHVAGYVFEGLGGGDFASVIAFSAAAALTIGAYVMLSALPLSCVFWFLRRRISKGTQRRATRWIAGVLLLLIAGSVLAALFALAGAMMIINAAIVLIALLGAGVLMALRIVGLAKRRFHGSLT
jgi:hypothetical protein